MSYKYVIKALAVRKVRSFYRNVSLKYPNTFTYEDMLRYVNTTVDNIYGIEQTVLRRKPTIERWNQWYMARTGNWYYAYSIDGDTIIIHDACHAQNMHNAQ